MAASRLLPLECLADEASGCGQKENRDAQDSGNGAQAKDGAEDRCESARDDDQEREEIAVGIRGGDDRHIKCDEYRERAADTQQYSLPVPEVTGSHSPSVVKAPPPALVTGERADPIGPCTKNTAEIVSRSAGSVEAFMNRG